MRDWTGGRLSGPTPPPYLSLYLVMPSFSASGTVTVPGKQDPSTQRAADGPGQADRPTLLLLVIRDLLGVAPANSLCTKMPWTWAHAGDREQMGSFQGLGGEGGVTADGLSFLTSWDVPEPESRAGCTHHPCSNTSELQSSLKWLKQGIVCYMHFT